jgi:hypothetical protein
MGTIKSMVGERYSNLTVLEYSCIKNNNSHWICRCELCGNKTEVSRPNLRSGNTVDCGCLRSKKISESHKTHGLSKSSTWKSWSRMHRRIKLGERHSEIYGKIKVCDEWKSFECFLKDMGERPKGHTIDRIDNTKGYYKENCRWATQTQQCRNKSNNVNITFEGKTMCIADWSDYTGLHRDTITRRLKRGLTTEEVLKK